VLTLVQRNVNEIEQHIVLLVFQMQFWYKLWFQIYYDSKLTIQQLV